MVWSEFRLFTFSPFLSVMRHSTYTIHDTFARNRESKQNPYIRYFKEKLHCFDAFVIVMGFAVDLLEHNVVEEIASLVVILRLWRFVKIVDEFSVEASEQTEDLRQRIEDLEKQNRDLRAQIGDRDGIASR